MATHGKARTDTINALVNRKPFNRSGFGMTAVAGAASSTGRLPDEYASQYRQAAGAQLIAYTVLSYATPIAWVTTSGMVVVPAESYSVTTSHHQGLARTYL